MDRLSEHTPAGMDAASVRRWGFLFLAAGLLGKGLIQTHLLGFRALTMEQMLTQMSASQQVMILASVSLVLQAAETCAAPIFAHLLTERARTGRDLMGFLGRLALLAAVCELPYNFALSGKLWDFESRNPVFAMVLSLVMLLFYLRYQAPGLKNTVIKLGVTLAAIIWGGMLSIDHGAPMVLISAIIWLLRSRPLYRGFAGATAAIVCMAFSPFYLASPMGFLAVHNYRGESEEVGMGTLLVYPALLAAVGAAGYLLPIFL